MVKTQNDVVHFLIFTPNLLSKTLLNYLYSVEFASPAPEGVRATVAGFGALGGKMGDVDAGVDWVTERD